MPEIRYGPLDLGEISSLPGLEVLQGIIDGRFPAAPIAEVLNFRLVEVARGFAVFEGEPRSSFLNPLGSVHGGWALTLIDSAAGCAGQSTLAPGLGFTTVETKVNFTRAIQPDGSTIRAEGRVVAQGRQIITTEVRMTRPDGVLVAHGTSTLMVLHPR
jgi:uncharacterized protein (TIGR00369 family)